MNICVICGATETWKWYNGKTMCGLCYRRGGKLPPPKPTTEERFWSKVQKTETCWLWTAGKDIDGFGQFRRDLAPKPKYELAHRYSYNLHFGSVDEHKRVEQTCSNKLCVNPKHLLMRSEQDRFWAFVYKFSEANSGCWLWTGALDTNMYGVFTTDQHEKTYGAHRYSWELANRHVISTPLLCVCHKCDHPWCVNPEHLFLGTTQENTEDMVKKGRNAKGIKHWKAKLTENDIRFIRQSPLGVSELARMFNISYENIYKILKRISWKHIA